MLTVLCVCDGALAGTALHERLFAFSEHEDDCGPCGKIFVLYLALASVPMFLAGSFLGVLVILGQGSKDEPQQVVAALLLLLDVLFKLAALLCCELRDAVNARLHARRRRALARGIRRALAGGIVERDAEAHSQGPVGRGALEEGEADETALGDTAVEADASEPSGVPPALAVSPREPEMSATARLSTQSEPAAATSISVSASPPPALEEDSIASILAEARANAALPPSLGPCA